jgi:hypothetical protein
VPDPAPYCNASARFTADLRTSPVLELAPPRLRVKRVGSIAFTLSKVSSVSVTVVRRGRVVLLHSARLGRGAHRVRFRPRARGVHEIRLVAVDLAGNRAATAGNALVTGGTRRPQTDAAARAS